MGTLTNAAARFLRLDLIHNGQLTKQLRLLDISRKRLDISRKRR
jgi:hypothetical protein